MDYTKEIAGKLAHDPYFLNLKKKPPLPLVDDDDVSVCSSTPCHKTHQHFAPGRPPSCFPRQVWVPGPVIVGAGPSGLAVAACLKRLGIPRLILEKSSCIASLWQLNTYDRLRLHLPKHFCELPYFPFPSDFPTYPTKQHFIAYLEAYVKHFSLKPVFDRTVVSAEFDKRLGLWRVVVSDGGGGSDDKGVEYLCRWVIVASGENAEPVMPEIEGLDHFEGKVVHTSSYKSGEEFMGKRVLVVGCGNSGMEVSLDLCNHNARPALVVRDSVHILPQEMLGTSTFGLSMWLLKWFPVCLVDRLLLLISRIMLGDIGKLGLNRPSAGPLQLKNTTGKTPVLDVGTLAEIRAGNIEVFPGVSRIMQRGVEFVDGRFENFDAIILATGYKSNISSWLKRIDKFAEEDLCPCKPIPEGWKGENGLYAVGFTNRGILGLSFDARRIADDIQTTWKINEKRFMFCP